MPTFAGGGEVRRLLILLLSSLLLTTAPARAQNNPAVTACGLPASGRIVQTVTYTLTADCTLTDTININTGVTVTINGQGYRLMSSAVAKAFFTSSFGTPNAILNINRLTLDGEDEQRDTQSIDVVRLNLNRVTITGLDEYGYLYARSNANYTLTNVLLENNSSRQFSETGDASALEIRGTGNVTLNHAVIRGNRYGSAAIKVASTATLTATGCLTFAGNAPKDVDGSWTDNSTGPCRGPIGNGGQADMRYPPASCGLPRNGFLARSATYRLTADCVLTGNLFISAGARVRIVGNGFRISNGAQSCCPIILTAQNSRLDLTDAYLDGIRIDNFGVLEVERIVATGVNFVMIRDFGKSSFRDALFENIRIPDASTSVLLTASVYDAGAATFTDAIFRNNHSSASVLRILSGQITLNGCITFEGNTPAGTSGGVTFRDTGPCTSIQPPTDQRPPDSPDGNGAVDGGMVCFHKLGAIGLICRVMKESGLHVEVWGVTPDSRGYFILGVTQPLVDAVLPPQALVACSADGRVAARVWADRNITFAMGPSPGGKTHHATIEGHLNGPVIGTIVTYDGPPCAPRSAPVAMPTPVALPTPAQLPMMGGPSD